MSTDTSTTKIWDYAAYAAIPADGNRHEIIDGEHHMNPAPNLYHQHVSKRLYQQFFEAIERSDRGVVWYAPVDVQLDAKTIVQPDLVVILKPQLHIMTPLKVLGVPDLLIEILSPSNSDYDLIIKRRKYESAGVGEYWIVFPDEHQILQLILRDGKYVEQYLADTIMTHIPPNVTIDLTKVW